MVLCSKKSPTPHILWLAIILYYLLNCTRVATMLLLTDHIDFTIECQSSACSLLISVVKTVS